jgi:hypothetical protein
MMNILMRSQPCSTLEIHKLWRDDGVDADGDDGQHLAVFPFSSSSSYVLMVMVLMNYGGVKVAGLRRVDMCMRVDLVEAVPSINRPMRGFNAPLIDLNT